MRKLTVAAALLTLLSGQALAFPFCSKFSFNSADKKSDPDFATRSITNLGLTGQKSEEDKRKEAAERGRSNTPSPGCY